MANPFDQFDQKTNPFDQFDEQQKPKEKETHYLQDLVEGAKGTGAFAGDILAGMLKVPAQAALAAGGKIAEPSRSLQDTWDTAGQAIEETFPSFTKPLNVNPETNTAYSAGMYPFQKYGELVNYGAKKASFGNKDVEGALNILGAVGPIPFAGKIGRGLGEIATRLDPGLYNIDVKAQNAKLHKGGTSFKDIVAAEHPEVKPPEVKPNEPPLTNEARQYPLFDQPEEGRVANPFEAQLGDWRIDENGIPIKADLSMELQNLQDPLQAGLWGNEMEPRRNPVGQSADLFSPEGQQSSMGMGDIPARELQGTVEPSGTLEGAILEATPDRINYGPSARGIIDPDLLTFGVSRLLQYVKDKGLDRGPERVLSKFKGTFNLDELKRYATESKDPMSRERLVWMKPDDFHKMAEQRVFRHAADDIFAEAKRQEIDRGLATTTGLSDIPWLKIDANGKVWGHEGRHRMDVFKARGIDLIPVRIETSLARNSNLDTNMTITGQDGKSTMKFPEPVFPLPEDNPYAGRFNKQRGAIFRKPEDKATLPSSDDLKLLPKYPAQQESPSNKGTIVVSKSLGLEGTPYSRVNTAQQVLENPGKDLPNVIGHRTLVDPLQSGLEGTLRHNPNNAGVNMARSVMQAGRNAQEQLSKHYLTDADTGLNAKLNKLSTKEKVEVVGLMLELDRQQKPLTDSILDRAGFTEDQKAAAIRMREADDALYAAKNKALGEQGYDSHTYREGHMPGNFGGAYRTLIGYTDDKGFHITGIAQADTKLGHSKAVEWYKSQGDKYSVEIPLGRKQLGTRTYNSAYDGWADVISEIAKHDPEFSKALAVAEQKGRDAVASLYDFHLHEKAKKGIVGTLGNRPWLSAEQNAKEFLKGFIDYLEEGYKYTAYQAPLNEISKLTRDPNYRDSHPNTVSYLEKYVRHITGNSLNPIGAAANWTIDRAAAMVGIGNSQFTKLNSDIAQASTLHMMGIFNPGFFLAQLTQWATGGIPEAMQARAALKQDPQLMINSLQRAIFDITKLSTEKGVDTVAPHIQEAYKWGKDNGLFTFSELALAHQVLQSKLRRQVTPYFDWPIRLGEQATRPTIFLTFADMFHNAGFRGEEAWLRAQTATDWAMVNYHPDERPMLYQSLGVIGNSLGALSTYKHNLVSQLGQRVSEGAKGKNMAAAATMLGLGYALYGISGLPGYQEASDLAEKLTDKPLREILLDDPGKTNSVMDGLLSAKTGLDFQSRLSMSSVLPDSPLSAFPHISNFMNIMDKAYEAGAARDTASLMELAKAGTPAGLRGVVEQSMYPDGYMLNKDAKNKYPDARTAKEQVLRDILGVRPLRERLYDEQVWSERKSEAKRMDDLKKAQTRFDRSFLLKDQDGMAKAEIDYEKASGDPNTLWNKQRLDELIKQANLDEKMRRAGKPTNLNTLKRFEEFTQ